MDHKQEKVVTPVRLIKNLSKVLDIGSQCGVFSRNVISCKLINNIGPPEEMVVEEKILKHSEAQIFGVTGLQCHGFG